MPSKTEVIKKNYYTMRMLSMWAEGIPPQCSQTLKDFPSWTEAPLQSSYKLLRFQSHNPEQAT